MPRVFGVWEEKPDNELLLSDSMARIQVSLRNPPAPFPVLTCLLRGRMKR